VSHSGVTGCSRWMSVSISDAVGATSVPSAAWHRALAGCRGATSQSGSGSSVIPSGSSTSTLQRCRASRASSASLQADRTSRSAVTRSVNKAARKTVREFLEHLLKAVPYRIHTMPDRFNRNTAYSRQMRFDMIGEANRSEHRLTRPNHPWTNGQVERMNRTIKDATVKRYHRSTGSRPANTSAKSGLQSQIDPSSIRSNK